MEWESSMDDLMRNETGRAASASIEVASAPLSTLHPLLSTRHSSPQRGRLAAMLACVITLSSGCDSIPKNRYDQSRDYGTDLQRRLDRTNLQLADLTAERERAVQRAGQIEQQLAGRQEIEEILEKRVDNLRRENDRLHAELTGIVLSSAGSRRSSGAIVNAGGATAVAFELPKELIGKLTAFAGQHEGVSFDPAERVVRFPANRIFANDGDRLSDESRGWFRELAEILNTPPAKRLNLLIVGHSSNRWRLPPDQAAIHPTDWHLTAHQAIAVEQQLEEGGLTPSRVGIVGYAGQQPLVEGADNKKLNARVELFLLPPDPPADRG